MFVVADAHAVQHNGVHSLQLRLSFGELLQTNFFCVFARDIDNLGIGRLLG
jgi:hypothetical protein